jgi:hypothetical protein
MKKLLFGALLLALVAAGCAITDYPVITDDRGSYSGVIRTGHKAYIVPSGQVATIWTDGSDELFSLVYQNQYGDQKIYTFNNFDPTGSVNFLDQTYCDWRYEGCEITRAWNPANANIDDTFDYEFFPDCSGARSISVLVSYTSRIGECGDGLMADKQNLYAEFANLATTNWRGGVAYVVPMNASNTSITLTANNNTTAVPMFGQTTGFITEQLQFVLPMTPNTRHQLRWLSGYAAENGARANMTFGYGALSTTFEVAFAADGINHNLNRY